MNTTRVWAITGIAAAFALVGACSGGDEPGTGLRERVGERRESIVEAPANGGVVTMAGTGAPAFHDDTPLASSFNDPAGIAVGPDGAIYVADWGNNAVRRIRASDGNVETVVRGFENLIKNPRAEQTPSATPGIPQWDIVTGAWIPTSKAECATALCGYPFDGSRWFWGGNVTSAQLKQDISLANRGIAQGGQHAIFEIWMRSLTAERSRALVEYFDAQGVLKTSYDTGEHADSTWTPYVDDRILPTTVTKAKVTLFTRATSGGAADSYFDGLQLRISNGGINPILDHGFVAVSAVGVTNTGKIYVGASDGLSVFDAPANTVIATRTATLPLPHVANIATLSDGYAYAADSYHVHLWGILPGAAGFYPVNVLGGSNAEPLAVAAKVINASTHRLYVSYRRYFEVDVFDCPVGTAQGVAVTCTNANVVIGAGQGFADDMDGTAGGERLGYPHGLALGRFGEVLIADEANHSVRRSFLPLTQTSAGTGVLGFTADGPSNLARFWSPTGVAATPAGDIVVTDRMNNRVRKIVCAGSNACAATAGMNCPVLPASDNEPCTTDTCLTLGVNHVPKAAGAACDDGTVCNGSETCSAAGVCQAGTPLTVTPDTNPCTADYCDPVSGGVHVNLPNGTPCLVADPCQTAGSCSSGVCGGTQLVNINDNNDCTIDACTASGITHTGVSGNPPCGGGTGVCFAETCRDSGSGLGAPPLDGTIAASLADSFSSLTSGTNPQHVPDASKIDPKRAALIRGRVVDTSGAPLGGVTVSIADHTEYGYFGTSTSGEFFLEVNGGAPLTVRFAGPFFMLVAERRVSPEWGGTVGLYDVVLVRNDQFGPPQMVTIGSASPAAWVTGSTVSETVAGATVSHKTSMFFPAGTTTTPAMTSLQLRVVEYTLGPKGAQAMPADIATNTAYTYAAEFSVDSSIESVEFAKPVFAYVDNFMNVAAGTMVPAGYYDRAKHIWVPETNQVPTAAVPNGRVISLDASCNADAASQTYFSGLGANYAFTAAEQAKLLAAGYANKTVWRMPLLHFSPHDFNFTAQPPKCEAVGAAPGTDCADTSSASCACPDADGRVAGNDEPEGGSCEGSGSIIKLEQQILGEQLPVGGTPFTLNYRSDRVPGYLWGRTAEINFDGPKHSKLKQYKVRLAVAGQIRDQVFSPNVSGPQYFTWDGLDFAGRRIVGSQKASIEVSSVYPVSYVSGERFMDYPSGTSVGITSDARGQATEMVASKEAYRYFHNLDAAALGLGGWSLSPFHQYDPDERVLYLGDGERRTIDDSDNVVSAVAGSGISIDPGGTVATDATFGELNDMVASPSGELFIAKLSPAVVQKIGADNKITTVAGSGTSQNPPPAFVEGAVATATQLWRQDPVAPVAGSAKGIALAADGTLYIADGMSFLYRVDPAGKIWTVAGVAGVSTVADCGAANNVVAKGARLCSPTQVAVAPDGAVYVNSKNAQNRTVIKRIDPGATTANSPARITTVAGGGTTNDATHVDSNMRATQLGIAADTTFQVGPDGSLWFTSAPDIYRLHPNGRLQPYPASASTASACNFKRFYAGQDLSITPDNAVVFREFGTGWGQSGGRCEDRIYRLGSDDVLTNAVGNGVTQNNSDPPKLGALSSRVSLIYEITAVGPDGAIYFAQRANHRIYKSARPNPRQDAGCVYSIPSDDGAEFYCFNDKGRHLFTFDSKTGAKLYTFLPTTGGPVTSITDVANRVTNIAYTGTTATITSPYGQTTVITLSQGYATSIKNSLGVAASVTHNYQGLLTSFTPAGNTGAYTFGYDQLGRLTRDSDPNGGVQTFNRTPSPTDPSVTRVTRMTAQGRASSYDLTVGDSMNQSRAVTGQDGNPNTSTTATTTTSNGPVTTTTMADRTIIERILDSDARWGMMAPLAASTKITVPTSPALTRTETQANCYNDASTCPDDAVPPVNHTSYDVVDTNGRKLRTAYDSGTRTFTTTSPMGRVTKKVLDAQGRVISTVEPGDSTTSNTATNYTYVNGQLTTVARGARQATFGYWPGTSGGMSGYQQTSTDFDGTTTTAVDAMGRATTITQSTALTSLTWSPSGRLEAISPPGRPGHDPQYNQVGLMTKYVPPTLTGIDTTFNWDYSRDRDLELARLAGTSIDYIYDSAKGRLTELRFPEDTITYGYYGNAVCAGCAPGRLQTAVAASSGNTTTFEYAGQLQTKVTQARSQSPTWSVATSWTYDSNFWPISEKVEKAGGTSTTVTYGFDDDGVVKCASVGTCAETTKTFTITPWPKSARPNTLKLDTVSEARAFNTFGELKSQTLTRVAVPTALISLEYEQTGFPRDGLGRVSDLKETVGATPKTTHYEYDEFGRLFEVIVNGSEVVGHYEYDANGNRGNGTIWKNKAGQLVQGTFQYDAQDRLLSFASSTPGVPSVTYEYTPKGDLKRAYGTSFDYRYIYDARGGLRSATTAGGIIDYLLDASGRRVGRRKNGTLERQWVYAKSGSAIAELDGSGNIVSRFVYATGRNVPDFMVTVTDGVIYRIFSDQLGSVRMVVNAATGAIKQELDYDAFGNVLTDTLPQFQPFGFAGGIYDVDTGFVRFGARDYDPSVGRWVSKDPILFDGEQANLYVYVNNDPLNHRDPSGTDESDPSFFDLAYVGGRVLLCHYLGIACPEPDAGPDRGFTGGGALPSGARPAMPEVCTEPKKEKDSCAQACVPYLGRNARYIGTDGHVYRNDLGGLWAFNRCVAECRGKTIN